jgi:glycosyltransferase involved in cell wall biosynthesis
VRIVYLITRADAVGGASIHVRDLARAFMARGDEVTVVVGGEGPVSEQMAAAGVPVRSVRYLGRPIHPLKDALALGEVTGALAELRPDLVSTHTAKAGWIGRAAARRLGIPAVYTPHGWSLGPRVSGPAGTLYGMAERMAARWCSAIICVCEQERQLALEKGIAPAGKLVVVHNGVRDVDPGLMAHPERTPVRLCSVARFAAPKDHHTLLSALALVDSEGWELDLVGDGPLLPEIRGRAEALGLPGRIRFHGYVADPASLLSCAQGFVLASRSEAFPRSILEAMRAGLPVAASNVGGVAEAVTEGSTGLLTTPGDPAALAASIRRLLADPVLRRRMGLAGRAAYEKRFRLERMVDCTAGIYARLRK